MSESLFITANAPSAHVADEAVGVASRMADNGVHVWDDYHLSAEVVAMAPAQRKSIYGDYKEKFSELLEEKYRMIIKE